MSKKAQEPKKILATKPGYAPRYFTQQQLDNMGISQDGQRYAGWSIAQEVEAPEEIKTLDSKKGKSKPKTEEVPAAETAQEVEAPEVKAE